MNYFYTSFWCSFIFITRSIYGNIFLSCVIINRVLFLHSVNIIFITFSPVCSSKLANGSSKITIFPFLITLSQYKTYITLLAFLLILLAGYINYKTYYMPCPADPELGRACSETRKKSRYLYYASVAIFLFATIFTYIVPRFL